MRTTLLACLGAFALSAMAQTPTDVLAQLPDFPHHWNQAGLYNQVIRDEYGNGAPAGCVAVAGAACMEWSGAPAAFGAQAFTTGRALRTEPLDWGRLAPTPLDARGRRSAQTVLYNLGLLTAIYYVEGGSSTTPLINLAAALTAEPTGYASAYSVPFNKYGQTCATDEDVRMAIWSALRCGSPVAMSVERDGGAHAIVATGCGTDAARQPLTQVFGGYGVAPTWMDVPTSMPVPGGYTYSRLASVVTGIVAERPEGAGSRYAFPVLGQVKGANGPLPFARVTLTAADGSVLARTATDLKGRFGLWGWFGTAMRVTCGEASADLPAQAHGGTVQPIIGTPFSALEVPPARLAAAIQNCERTLTVAESCATIHTSLTDAVAAAQASGTPILCLNSEDPDLKDAFRRVAGHTLLYADPRQDTPFSEVDDRPDASCFLLDASGTVVAYALARDAEGLAAFLANPVSPEPLELAGEVTLTEADNGRDVVVSEAATVTVEGDVRLGALTIEAPLTLTGEGTCVWATLDQRAALTLAGPNLRYVPPKVGDGTGSAFPDDLTVRDGAELHFARGDVSGYDLTEGTIALGSGGILAATSRDTLHRPLTLAGGHIDLGDKGGNFGSLDLFGTTLTVTADSTVSALSGAQNPRLMARKGTNTIRFANDARLTIEAPIAAAEKGTLTLSGQGKAAFRKVSAPVIVGSGVLLEGGDYAGGLSLTGGARLTAEAPITVTGSFSAAGEIVVEGVRSGLLVKGAVSAGNATFKVEPGFEVRTTAEGLRLVATHATDPVIYVGGAEAEALPDDPARNLLVLTTTDRKESGLWDAYAAFRSSAEGGGWNVMVAAVGNIPAGQGIADYLRASGCDFVLIGASATEIPALDGVRDRLDGLHVGRLPLRESVSMGTKMDVGSDMTGQDFVMRSDAELLAEFVGKLHRAGQTHAPGTLTLHGGGFGVPDQYDNNSDFAQWDGLPPFSDTTAWYFPTQLGITIYALRDRACRFRQTFPGCFSTLSLYDDQTYRVGKTEAGRDFGRWIVSEQDNALLWVEGQARRDRLGIIAVGNTKNGLLTAEAISGLSALVLSPSGLSGDLSQEASPSVGEMLVLNPEGGALAAILPAGEAPFTVGSDGIPAGVTHTACGAIAEALIADPDLTVGEAFSRAAGETPLTLLGDPTVRVAPYAHPSRDDLLLPEGEADAPLSDEAIAALVWAGRAARLTPPYRVASRTVDGSRALPMSAIGDALACLEGLAPVVEDGEVVVAYDFAVTDIAVADDAVEITLAFRAPAGQTVRLSPSAVCRLVPTEGDALPALQRLDGDTGWTRLLFARPQGATALFRGTLSPAP